MTEPAMLTNEAVMAVSFIWRAMVGWLLLGFIVLAKLIWRD